METPKTVLLGRTLNEIQHITQNLGMPKFAAKQIASWLYEKKVASIDEMTNLSLKHREMLKDGYEVGASAPVEAMRSVDGTVKYLFRTAAGKRFLPPGIQASAGAARADRTAYAQLRVATAVVRQHR